MVDESKRWGVIGVVLVAFAVAVSIAACVDLSEKSAAEKKSQLSIVEQCYIAPGVSVSLLRVNQGRWNRDKLVVVSQNHVSISDL